MSPRRRHFKAQDLRLVGRAYLWPHGPAMGAAVTLNSGGPRMLVVDVDRDPQRCIVSYLSGDDVVEAVYDWRLLRPWIER